MRPVSNCFISCDKEYDVADVVILGIPYDGTSSFRPGSRFAPEEIRKVSYSLETYSPYQHRDMEEKKICDLGDLELSFGNKIKILERIETEVDKVVEDGKKILSIGGEHLITLPVIKSFLKKFSDLYVIHFDAHADLREDYLGETLSHATVMRRVIDLVGADRVFHYGIRSGTKDEFDILMRNGNLNLDFDEIKSIIEDKPVYFTLDLDILDPSILPGTGTPEPGGLTFKELIDALLLLRGLNIVGCDVVELSPDYDSSKVSSVVAAKIIREILIFI